MPTHDEVAGRLAARMAPAVQQALNDHRAEFRSDLSWAGRCALDLVWPAVVGHVPVALGAGLDAVLAEFGAMTARDLLTFLADHAAARGDHAAADRLRADVFALVVRG